MIDKVTCTSEDIDTKSNKKKRAFFVKGLSGSAQRPGLSAVLIFCVTIARYFRWVKIES